MLRLKSIRSKLFAIFLVTGAVPIVGVSLIAYHNSLRAVEDMVGNRASRFAQTVRDELARKLDRRLNDRILWENQPVQDFLGVSPRRDPRRFQRAQDDLLEYLPQLLGSYAGFYDGILLADADGKPILKLRSTAGGEEPWTTTLTELGTLLAEGPDADEPDGISAPAPPPSADRPGRTLVELPRPPRDVQPPRVISVSAGARGISDEDRAAARLAAQLGPGQVRVVTDVPQPGGRRAVRILRPIVANREPDRRIGFLVADVKPEYLFREDLPSERFGETGEILIVDDETDEVLFDSNPETIGKRLRQVDPALARVAVLRDDEAAGPWKRVRGSDGDRLVVSYRLAGAPWTVLATATPREFEGETLRAGIYNLMVASAALLLAAFVLLTAGSRISNSIKTVTAGARRIAGGRLDHTIQVRTHDEIQTLAEAFNQMTRSLSESIAMRERAARELEDMNRTLEDRVRERTRALEELNAALGQANSELKELDRLKSNFLATVSHEFKTPLTSIKAFAEILLDETSELGGSEEVGRFLRIIHSESERLARLIRNLLSLSQIESGRITWAVDEFPIRQAVDAALDGLLPVFKEKDVRVDRDLACPDTVVRADLDRIQEVVTNLLENALKFTERSGSIRVACRGRNGGSAGREVEVTVRDAGPGIPPDHHETIFERFSQVDPGDTRAKGGSGLGLAICREIVEHHGGRIWVESEPGQGAAFHFTLPVTVGDPVPGGSCG